MTILAGSTETEPTHHASITDGTNTIGFIFCDSDGNVNIRAITASPYPRTAMKTTQGDSKYSDLEPPYMAIAQDDFTGGRGEEDFDRDTSRFNDNNRCNITRHGIILGGRETYATGYRDQDFVLPGSVTFVPLYGATRYIRRSFVASASYDADKVEFWVRKIGSPSDGLYAVLYDNSGNVLKSKYLMLPADEVSALVEYNWTGTQALVASTTYYIGIYANAADTADDHYEVGCDSTASTNTYKSTDGTSWSAASYALYFRITDADNDFVPYFFDYKETLYVARRYLNGNYGGDILINGYAGYSTSTNTSKITDTYKTWDTNELADCVVKFIAGGGFRQTPNWRRIYSNTSNEATVTPLGWYSVDQAKGEYVIVGSDKWSAVSVPNMGMTYIYPYDIAVANNVVHIAQSETNRIVKMYRYFDGTDQLVYDGGYTSARAQFILPVVDYKTGTLMYMARNIHNDYDYDCELYVDQVPVGWISGYTSTSHYIQLLDSSDYWDEQTVTNVAYSVPDGYHTFQIKTGVVTGVHVNPTAAGTGYTANDILDVVDTNATGCKVKVLTVDTGGEVLTLELNTAGTGYSVGTGKATTGGTGSGCTISILTTTSFTTGIIASADISEKDMRFTTELKFSYKSDVALNAGDLSLLIDNTANCASPIMELELGSCMANSWSTITLVYDTTLLDGLDKVISIGLKLNTDQFGLDNNGVTTIKLVRSYYAYKKMGAINISGNGDKITGLELYGDPETPWVFTEKGVGEIRNFQYKPISLLREMEKIRSENNGAAHCVSDVFLYFSMQDGLEKYFRQNLDDVGPNRDAGLPANRQGPISHLIAYPGSILASIDGGMYNYSSIMLYDGIGWSELYRSPNRGDRIWRMHVQTIPGTGVAKLWFGMGSDLLWIPLCLNPYYDENYRFTHDAHLITSWYYAGMRDIVKHWKSLKLFMESTSAFTTGGQKVEVDYRLDSEYADWINLPDEFDTPPSQEVTIDDSTPPTSSGKRIQFRLRLSSNSDQLTPRVKALVVEGVTFVPVKYQYTFSAQLRESDMDIDLDGEEDTSFPTVESKFAQLSSWANSGTALTWRCNLSPLDNKTVYIDPASLNPVYNVPDEQVEQHIIRLTVYEA